MTADLPPEVRAKAVEAVKGALAGYAEHIPERHYLPAVVDAVAAVVLPAHQDALKATIAELTGALRLTNALVSDGETERDVLKAENAGLHNALAQRYDPIETALEAQLGVTEEDRDALKAENGRLREEFLAAARTKDALAAGVEVLTAALFELGTLECSYAFPCSTTQNRPKSEWCVSCRARAALAAAPAPESED
jgi:hypothetical protein